MNHPTNLFAAIPLDLPEEVSETLLETSTFRVERIVSHGHASPPGFWYDQAWHEWVAVVRGAASLRMEGEQELRQLKSGDVINIPAGQRHRVEWTDPDQPTVWLAIHYGHGSK